MAYSTINKVTDYFNTITYSGNGSNPRNVTGVGFNPDWTIVKARTGSNARGWMNADNVRGSSKNIVWSENTAEFNPASIGSGGVSALISDGFTTVSGTSQAENSNESGYTYVAYNWLANGAGSSNSNGSITSTVSANQTAGFSIVSFTGTQTNNVTVGHGLGAKPDFIIAKGRAVADNWGVYHTKMGAGKGMYLNTTTAQFTSTALWYAEPTSTIVTLGDNESVNHAGNMIMYCFAEKKGYSKFGSYTGNGYADGTFVYTGFKPALIIIKSTGHAENWFAFDNKRPGYNLNANHLNPNSSTQETASSANTMDILSNGFKMKATNNGINRSGDTFIYAAFGQPLVGSNNVPCTAR